MDKFYKRLIFTRLSMNLTKKEFGELGGVTDVSQGRYEEEDDKKRRIPDINYLLNLKQHGIDIQYLLTGESSADNLTGDESFIVESYRAASPASQKLISDLCRALTMRDAIPNTENNISINSDTHENIKVNNGDYMPKGKKKL